MREGVKERDTQRGWTDIVWKEEKGEIPSESESLKEKQGETMAGCG